MRGALPTGAVTFLFTDIEGSTKLLLELAADRYAKALAEHRRIIREAVSARGGVEVGTEGDAFFVAFRTASGALDAAAKACCRGFNGIRLQLPDARVQQDRLHVVEADRSAGLPDGTSVRL